MIPRNILLGGLVATASLAAQAQSSVTLYGLIDIAPAMVSRTNTADDRLFRLNSDTGSSSRFGVRGTEDLGGGLAAFFNLEAPLDAKNGSVPGGAASGACNAAAGCASATTPAFWRRNAYVGLRGGFGEVTFGRNYTAAVIKQAATLSATPSGINTGMATNLAAQGLSNDFWNSNQIRYDSPKFGPIDFSAHVALGEGVTGRNVGGNVGYNDGPLAISLSYQRDENLAGDAVKWMILSGSYNFGSFKVHVAFDDVNNDEGVTGFRDSKFWTVGASFKATPMLTLAAQYWNLKDSASSNSSKQVVLNADYALSRRTALFAMLGHVNNKDIAVLPLWSSGVTVANDKVYGLAAGVRHSF